MPFKPSTTGVLPPPKNGDIINIVRSGRRVDREVQVQPVVITAKWQMAASEEKEV
jgi:hypothetical protein